MKSFDKELFPIYLLVDLIILNCCFIVFHVYRLDAFPNVFPEHLMYFLHFNISWIFAYFVFKTKCHFIHKGFLDRIFMISQKVLIYVGVFAVTTHLFALEYNPNHYFAEFIVLFYLGTVSAYFSIYKLLKYKRKIDVNTTRAVIVSNCEAGHRMRRIIESNPLLGYKFLGFIVSDNSTPQQGVLGSKQELEELIREHQIQIIFSVQDDANWEFNKTLTSKCDKYGVKLRFVIGNNYPFKLQLNVAKQAHIELHNPRRYPLDDAVSRIEKRCFDICFSSFLILFVFTWLFPIIVLMIKITSRGSVFFCQKRTGISNKTFTCLKFRSMKPNILSDIKQASLNDSRITPIGRFLRSTFIDELPQFFNVFLGQMSVIGPRPHMLKHTEQYSELIKHYLIRHYVKPGITGWAQINGFCGETDELWKMEKRVEYDMFYIRNWSFFADIQIVWHTVFKPNSIKIASSKSEILQPVLKESSRTENVRSVSASILSEV